MELKVGLIYLLLCRVWLVSEGKVVTAPHQPGHNDDQLIHADKEVKDLDNVIHSVVSMQQANNDATLTDVDPKQPKNIVAQEELKNVETVDIPARIGTQFRVHRIHHNPHHSQQIKVDIVNRVSNHKSRPPIETPPVDIPQGEDEPDADNLEDWPHLRDRLVQEYDLRDPQSVQWPDIDGSDALPMRPDASSDKLEKTSSMDRANYGKAQNGPIDEQILEGSAHSDHGQVAHLSNNRHYEFLAVKEDKSHVAKKSASQIAEMANVYFIGVVAACSVAGLIGVVMAGVCWYKLQKNVKAASEVEYPAYGIQGPTPEKVNSPGDRKLAHSAQMYHYQYQKQQMIALEKEKGDHKEAGSDVDSEDENEEGDYTVYECPGLAPTGEMEVKNPLFGDDTPLTPNASARSENK